MRYEVSPVGIVESPLRARGEGPRQGDEGAPETTIAIGDAYLPALDGIGVGDEVIVLTWLDRARRDVLAVHPRGDAARPLHGVFATRSPDRPNPIGLHRVRVLAVEGTRVRVANLEAIDGTPVLDIKPVLRANIDER